MQGKAIRFFVRAWLTGVLLAGVPGGSALAEPLIIDPAWKQGVLANGLHWQILSTPQRPVDRTEIRLLIRTGSLSESEQQNGYSHFLPRLALTQSGSLTVDQAQELWRHSIDPQYPEPPATTSYNYSVFSLSLPNNRNDLLIQALTWLADIPNNLKITSQTVRHALASEGMVASWPTDTQNNWWRYRLKGTSLAAHDPQANLLQPVNIPSLTSFYQTWYTPDVMTLVIVGNVDSRKLSEHITRLFGDLPGKRQIPAPLPALPPLPATPVSITSSKITTETIALKWDSPWQPIRDDHALIQYWQNDLARETIFLYLQHKLRNAPAGKIDQLTFACQVYFQRSQCTISLSVPAEKLNSQLRQLANLLAVLRDKGLTEEAFSMLMEQKRLELQQLFATYAHTDTRTLISQQMRALRDQVVDIAPEQYQKLRRRFLDDLSAEKLRQSLYQQLAGDPVLILFQPEGEAEHDIQQLQQTWNDIMQSASKDEDMNNPPQTANPDNADNTSDSKTHKDTETENTETENTETE